MRRGMCIMFAAMIVLALSASVSFAADKVQSKNEAQPAMQSPHEMGQGMMGQGMKAHGKLGKSKMGEGKMGCGMMEKKIVATQDGGVVVWIGNKLIKYNKDLKLVNEVELNIDRAAMQQKMMEQCPKMKGSKTDAHTIDPYHHKPGTTQPAPDDGDMHTVDPYHHPPK